jgi:hypothetical protein
MFSEFTSKLLYSPHDAVNVAIKKVTSFADEQSARQLLRELRLLRHFRGHENVLTITVGLNSLGHISKLDLKICNMGLARLPEDSVPGAQEKSVYVVSANPHIFTILK